MKAFIRVILCCLSLIPTSMGAAPYASLKEEAESAFAEGSFQKAHDLYAKVPQKELSAVERRWVEFRLADTELRSQSSSRQTDPTRFEAAEKKLESFLGSDATQDTIWAEANESIADAHWYYTREHNWSKSWPHYESALKYWASSTNINSAREHYLKIVKRIAQPSADRNYFYGYWGNSIPEVILENALKIAQSDEDKAQFHYLLAMSLRNQGGEWEQRFRIPKEFEAAVQYGKKTEWYDDALYFYAEWMNSSGLAVQDDNGNWSFEPDFQKALDLYRRFTREFRKGESRWYEPAVEQIKQITAPSVTLYVANVFLPGSEIQFHAGWRNVDQVQFTLRKVDLNEAVEFKNKDSNAYTWLANIDSSKGEKIKSWSRQTKPKRPYIAGGEEIRLDEKLERGAYLIEATSEGQKAREIILVTDVTIVTQVLNNQILAYVADSATGAPIPSAQISLWSRTPLIQQWHWENEIKEADTNGLALFEGDGRNKYAEIFISAKSGGRQAFAIANSNWRPDDDAGWKIYAITDQPAYRPEETVHWKLTARQMQGLGNYVVPGARKISLRITDPRGAEIKKSSLKLNAFGSAWGELKLTGEMPLGLYRAEFLDESENKEIGSATLFRLEEYKLPEFKVSIHTPEENGRKKAFLLGEKVEVEIQADYYFGGPVANATVEAVVTQQNFYHIFEIPREFPWYYSGNDFRRPPVYDPGQVVQRETLKTDLNGKAKLTIRSPFSGTDLQYRIEARVVDASRREITATENIRVSAQRFYVDARAAHQLYQPQDKVEVKFTARDINEQPMVTEGKVFVTRDFWFEIWLDPQNREVKGDQLKQLQRAAIWPPLPRPGEKGWRLKFRGYSHDQILSRTLKTDTNGVATISFVPEQEGYYRLSWLTDEKIEPGKVPSRPIRAETAVWVGTGRSTDLGYHPGGLEIVADKDTFRVGQKAPVMLSMPGNDRWVLFTVSGSGILHHQLIHLDGSVKLVELPVEESFVPNVFLNASSVNEQQLFVDQKEIIVPPTKNFLSMKIEPDQEAYRPGNEGHFTIQVRDDQDKPVAAEVALSVIDESLFYVQSDLAPDPRQFFFGTKRQQLLQTASSFQKEYRKTTREEKDEQVSNESLDRNWAYNDVAKSKSEVRLGAVARRYSMAGGRGMTPQNLTPMAAGIASAAPMMEKQSFEAPVLRGSVENAPPREQPAVQVRSDFRTSILWQPDIQTGSDGKASVDLKYPDSLTTWKATARGVTTANQFGIAEVSTRTQQPLIVRLQAPRFFLVGDTVTVSAVINNNTDNELNVRPEIVISGIDQPNSSAPGEISIKPHADARVNWTVHPTKIGEAKIKVIARSAEYSDAMEKSYPIYEHGIEKFLATSGKSTGEEAVATLILPKERKPQTTHLAVQVTPSLAVTMLDALPYLINYPYGCTEQTMSRFLPTAITSKTLKDLGLEPEDIMDRVFGGIDTNFIAKTHPGGRKSLEKMDEMVQASMQRLDDFQHQDGGWGWWKEGASDPFMTAYVLWGYSLAQDAKVKVPLHSLQRAAAYLDKKLVEAESDLPLQAWMLHALAVRYEVTNGHALSEFQEKAFANIWKNHKQLNAYTRALLALSAHSFGKTKEAEILVRNLANGVKTDSNPGTSILNGKRNASSSPSTAHWGEDGLYWRWSEGGVEATAFALRAMLAIDPKNALIDPVVQWLIKNRRGTQWSNTRDTAIVILALNDYLKTSGELKGELEFELTVNNHSITRKKISGADLLKAPSTFEIPGDSIQDGQNEIRIVRKSGSAPIYYACQATFFTLEEPITPAGAEIFVKRQYYKLAPVATLLDGYTHEKRLLKSKETVESGDRIEVVITIEAKNNYEYLLFEDLKPAGFEAVEVRSGEPLYAHQLRASALEQSKGKKAAVGRVANPDRRATGNSRSVYQELRDRKVALFLDKMPEGFWEIRYELRAETPGVYHALPLLGHAMYVPEIRGNSAETIVQVAENKEN